jgi:molecular chaperone GrpE
VSSSGDKGSFKTELPQDVLDAALNAVKKREAESGSEVDVPTEPGEAAAAPPGDEPKAPRDAKDEEIESLTARLEDSMGRGRDLMARVKDEHEKHLRAVADLENYKKRAKKENEDTLRFGNERLLKDFLPVLDNIDRALEPANAADRDSLRKGVEMIRKLFEDTLAKHGVKPFSSKGKPFDPNVHEAMSQAETDEMPPNHVYAVVLGGFTLNDRLVRPGLVVVSKSKPPSEAPSASPTGEDKPNG